MKRFLIFVILCLVIGSLTAGTVQLKSFDEVIEALTTGEQLRVVAHYGKCQLISSNEIQDSAPDAIGGMNIDTFEYFAPMSIGNSEGFVVFSNTSLINYGGYIYNYAKFKVSATGDVTILAQYANANDFAIEMDEKFFTTINNGDEEGAVYFYKIK